MAINIENCGYRDIQEYPSDICVAPGHRKSALRSDGSHWGSYLAVGRYGRGRAARSIRSGIAGIQSRWSVRSDATKPDRISGSTTLSRGLIRDHGSVRHRGAAFVSGERVPKARSKSLRRQKSEPSEQKAVPKSGPSNFRKNAHVAGIWLARDDAALLPCIRVAAGSHREIRTNIPQTWKSFRRVEQSLIFPHQNVEPDLTANSRLRYCYCTTYRNSLVCLTVVNEMLMIILIRFGIWVMKREVIGAQI